MPAASEFTTNSWPLHVTVADVFAIDWEASVMVEKLSLLLKGCAVATSVAKEDTFFGENGEVRVTLLEKTDSLTKLHYDVITLLKQGGWKPNDPQFAEEGFLPHSTVQPHSRLSAGDEVAFNALSIIDFFPSGDPHRRKLLATIRLNTFS